MKETSQIKLQVPGTEGKLALAAMLLFNIYWYQQNAREENSSAGVLEILALGSSFLMLLCIIIKQSFSCTTVPNNAPDGSPNETSGLLGTSSVPHGARHDIIFNMPPDNGEPEPEPTQDPEPTSLTRP